MIVLDCTELAQNPINTGIQRVVRALIQHWPSESPLTLATFDPARGLVQLPAAARAILLDTNAAADIIESRLAALGPRPPVPLDATTHILVPEVFYDHARCNFYHTLPPERAAFLVYDLIAYVHPAQINVRETAPLMPYLRVLREARYLAFISDQTRTDFMRRIRRNLAEPGPVLPLGADGLALERQLFEPARCDFLSIGSIDGRKNQPLMIAAFQRLWQRGSTAQLTLVGRAFPRADLSALEAVANHPHFTWHRHATDDELRSLLRRARACLYLSEIEGYSLPPVESLYAGIPVIVPSELPSISALPHRGQIRLPTLTPETIADAVSVMSDTANAAQFWAEAATLQLPRWADFASETARWVSALRP
jgi:glycosyltransferase involved in cell wall biosynthesis